MALIQRSNSMETILDIEYKVDFVTIYSFMEGRSGIKRFSLGILFENICLGIQDNIFTVFISNILKEYRKKN